MSAATNRATGAPGGRLAGVYRTKALPAGQQRSLAGRYAWPLQLVALAAFAWAFLGWFNETWLFIGDNPIWLNRFSEYAIILGFGIWRIRAEQNPYTRKRLMVLVAVVSIFWWLIPWLFPFFEPYLGYPGAQPAFPDLHRPGTLSFFLVLAAVLLFGRRVICGWGCPCVGIRETVGFAFRHKTLRGPWAWRLRHSKWFFFALYLAAGAVLLFPPNAWSASYLGIFAMLVVLPYFASMLLSPLTGNRAYCRYLCPYGATFGLLNRVGFYRLDFDGASCNDCGVCDQVCDMGIPVLGLGRENGRIDVVECMGCGRCVSECAPGSLAFHDVRSVLNPAVVRNRHRLRAWASSRLPTARPQAWIFAAVLVLSLAASWWFSAAVGSANELPTQLSSASFCFAH